MFLKVLTVLAALIVVSMQTQTHTETVTECPGHPGMCKDSTTGIFHASGSTWTRDGECSVHRCNFPEITTESCTVPLPRQECHLKRDNTKAFPGCCPKVVC